MGVGHRAVWIAALVFICLFAFPHETFAAGKDLRRDFCAVSLGDGATNSDVINARYSCGADAPSDSDAWLWLRLDAAQLADLPRGWQLMVDQTRFDRIAVLVVEGQEAARITRTHTQLAEHWSPGGLLKFVIEAPGRQVTGLYLGFEKLDDLSLMRKIIATTATAEAATSARWLLLMGLFAGTLLSALLYNLVIYTGVRFAFQRWYLLWVATALVYGMVWTNMGGLLVPGFVGPMAVRLDFMLVGLLVATGNMFFLTVIEQGKLPRGMIWTGRSLAAVGALLGLAAALDMVFPAVLTDRLLNLVIAGTAVMVALSCWIAARRGSRIVWFYLIGWGPVIGVFLARLARNLGLSPQNDLTDMATFAALAFEALVLSLAIGDRFRLVSQELELAKQRRAVDAAEARALRIAAQTDFLTGLGNRAAFQETASRMIETGKPFSLFLIDVDHLKAVNDRFGHSGGDTLLREVGAALLPLAQAHPGTNMARIGGDEFAILIPGGLLPATDTERALTKLQGKVWQCMGQERIMSLSIGSAQFPEDGAQIEELHQNADLALYNAKRLGRTRHFRYDPLQRVLRDLQNDFANEADAALARDEFLLHVQPIVALPTGAVCGYEALLRWEHPDYGLMLPERFAGVLEAGGIGLRIQEHVLEMALGWLAEQPKTIGKLSVNFTAAQLIGPQAAQYVLDRLAHHGLLPASLSIEVTEAVLLGRSGDAIIATLQTLRESGICIALDSFGTGFTSLPHLRQMPIDRIKIDSSFIAGIDQGGGRTLAVVRAIAGLAHGLGKVLVAEGVETEAQAHRLAELGCQLAQGFLFGRPVPVSIASHGFVAPNAPMNSRMEQGTAR